MLDKIQNNSSESILQSQNADRIRGLGVSNPYEEDSKNFFIDQSDISSVAFEKYQKEQDIQKFSEILKSTDEQAASNLVMQQMFDWIIKPEDINFSYDKIFENENFINDIA